MRFYNFTLLTVILLMLSVPLMAQVSPAPTLMNFQGRLARPDGTPVANGNYSIRFSLWNVASGGTAAANEKWNQTVNPVTVRNGTFAVLLNVTSPASLFDTNLWLEIKIGTAAALTPRQQLVSVAFALKANTVPDNAITSAKIANATITGADIANATLTADKFASGALGWLLGGNTGTTTSHFLGTTSNQPLIFKANNRQVMRYQDVVNAGNTYHTVNVLGGAAINNIASGVLGATIAGGGQDNNSGLDSPNDIRGNFSTISGGSANFIDAFTFATIGGGSGNIVQGNYATVGGGASNNPAADYVTIGGGNSNYVFGPNATVGGGSNNSIGASLSTIAGGDANTITESGSAIGGGQENTVSSYYATVSGGFQNINGGGYGTIGGGAQNEVTAFMATIAGGSQNDVSGQYAFVGGGSRNLAGADTATIAGGDQNTVNGTFTSIGGGRLNYGWSVSDFSTIGGGYSNTVYGDFATIPGGYRNYADGIGSFAAGIRAYAAHGGSFVWADNHDADFISTADNQFCIRASGGMVFETFSHVPFYSGVGTTEANRYFLLLNSPRAASASGLKAGGILCADDFGYANPGKNDLVVKGTVSIGGYWTDPNYKMVVNGSIYSFGSYAGSDRRWKHAVAPLDNALDKILNLRGVSYLWDKTSDSNLNFPEGKQIGFIAQEVEKVLPELVSTDSKGYKAVAYANVVPVLVEAMKQQQAQIDALKGIQSENAELKARNAAMERQLAALAEAVQKLQNERK